MNENLTALASENLNPSLRSLLEDVQRGHIRVPRFQRPFVWTDDQRLELLQSVRDNMPIGSLLVWRTIQFKLASFGAVGPHTIPAAQQKAPSTGWQYLLDGHQRVSTLLGLLLRPDSQVPNDMFAEDVDEEIDWDIQYDLLEEDFVFNRKSKSPTAKHPLLPLWTLFDGRLVNRHMRDLRKRGEEEKWTEANLDLWEERADQLSYRFQQCRIPIVVMVTDDLKLAARTFQRINSLGTPMSEAHLVAALTWRADFDLRERIDELRRGLPTGWQEVDESLVLQICKGLVGLDMTKAGQSDLARRVTEDSELLQRAGTGLHRAIQLLSDRAGVVSAELLPYALQVSMLAVELAEREGSEVSKRLLVQWFWRTSWSEVFASASYRIVADEQINLRCAIAELPAGDWKWAGSLPDRFDFRSARARLFALRLARKADLCDEAGRHEDGIRLLSQHGRDALVRLFPMPRHASPELKRLVQGAGNRFFVDPSKEPILRDRLRYGPDLAEDALRSHFVTPQSLDSLREGDIESFLQLRKHAVADWDLIEWKAEAQRAERLKKGSE